MGPNDLFESKEAGAVLDSLIPGASDALKYKGLPYKGKPYTVSEDSLPVLKREVHIKQFDLSCEDDLKEYERIFQDKADGLNDISFEERVYDKDLKSWRVLLRWFDIYFTEPKKKKEFGNG